MLCIAIKLCTCNNTISVAEEVLSTNSLLVYYSNNDEVFKDCVASIKGVSKLHQAEIYNYSTDIFMIMTVDEEKRSIVQVSIIDINY